MKMCTDADWRWSVARLQFPSSEGHLTGTHVEPIILWPVHNGAINCYIAVNSISDWMQPQISNNLCSISLLWHTGNTSWVKRASWYHLYIYVLRVSLQQSLLVLFRAFTTRNASMYCFAASEWVAGRRCEPLHKSSRLDSSTYLCMYIWIIKQVLLCKFEGLLYWPELVVKPTISDDIIPLWEAHGNVVLLRSYACNIVSASCAAVYPAKGLAHVMPLNVGPAGA